MDTRLLPSLACPACVSPLEFSGIDQAGCLADGVLTCRDCKAVFELRDGIPRLAYGDPPRGSVIWEIKDPDLLEHTALGALGWARMPAAADVIAAVLDTRGIVVDVCTGPGGSLLAPLLSQTRDELLLVASDISPAVMEGQKRHFDATGLPGRCSFLVFDARRWPFATESVSAVISWLGLTNVMDNQLAYDETARCLEQDGHLYELARLFEEGSQSADACRRMGLIAPSAEEFRQVLDVRGLTLERETTLREGRGKTDPGDGLPVGDEGYQDVIMWSRKARR